MDGTVQGQGTSSFAGISMQAHGVEAAPHSAAVFGGGAEELAKANEDLQLALADTENELHRQRHRSEMLAGKVKELTSQLSAQAGQIKTLTRQLDDASQQNVQLRRRIREEVRAAAKLRDREREIHGLIREVEKRMVPQPGYSGRGSQSPPRQRGSPAKGEHSPTGNAVAPPAGVPTAAFSPMRYTREHGATVAATAAAAAMHGHRKGALAHHPTPGHAVPPARPTPPFMVRRRGVGGGGRWGGGLTLLRDAELHQGVPGQSAAAAAQAQSRGRCGAARKSRCRRQRASDPRPPSSTAGRPRRATLHLGTAAEKRQRAAEARRCAARPA